MLPTPDTSHVPYNLVYEPAEDSFLLLDTLSSTSERSFLTSRFSPVSSPSSPSASSGVKNEEGRNGSLLILEVGSGSGVVTAFLTAHAGNIFGSSSFPTRSILSLSTDVNPFACHATADTVRRAVSSSLSPNQRSQPQTPSYYLGALRADLVAPIRPGSIDVLVFNPPYVPTPEVPRQWPANTTIKEVRTMTTLTEDVDYDEESHLLELSYAGGSMGMEVTNRLLGSLPDVLSLCGCAYVLLCRQNHPEDVKERVRAWPAGDNWRWMAETVGSSGKTAGWERLVVVRIWRGLSELEVGDND